MGHCDLPELQADMLQIGQPQGDQKGVLLLHFQLKAVSEKEAPNAVQSHHTSVNEMVMLQVQAYMLQVCACGKALSPNGGLRLLPTHQCIHSTARGILDTKEALLADNSNGLALNTAVLDACREKVGRPG